MKHFFLEKHVLGMWELKNDVVFKKIPEWDYNGLIDFAWDAGKQTSDKYSEKYNTCAPELLAEKLGLIIIEADAGLQMPEYRVFSEYYSNAKKVILYRKAITDEFKILLDEGVTTLEDYDEIRRFFIAHEIFHHIECSDIGLISRKRRVITLKIGPVKITSGIRALSEIGAHSFTRNLLGLP